MTTTNEIIQKLNDALIKMPPTGCVETAECIEIAIKMLENKRMEAKRKKFMQMRPQLEENILFLRRQAG